MRISDWSSDVCASDLRIVRAKRTLSERQVPFEVPRRDHLHERLASVLGVVYLIFNEGYAATAGDDLMRPALCEEALRLGIGRASCRGRVCQYVEIAEGAGSLKKKAPYRSRLEQ